MANANRLVSLSMVPELAAEIAAQIDAAGHGGSGGVTSGLTPLNLSPVFVDDTGSQDANADPASAKEVASLTNGFNGNVATMQAKINEIIAALKS